MITDRSQLALFKPQDSVAVDLPHSQALHTHVSSLAFVHALQIVKGVGARSARAEELHQAIISLQKSFNLQEDQIDYIRQFYSSELHQKQHFIEERFGELEEKVLAIAKKKLKGKAPEAIEESPSYKEISRLQAILQISQDVISGKIQQKTSKLAENAFLVAVRDLAVLRGFTEDSKQQSLSLEDIKVIAQNHNDIEISPRLLERAVNIYERTIARR